MGFDRSKLNVCDDFCSALFIVEFVLARVEQKGGQGRAPHSKDRCAIRFKELALLSAGGWVGAAFEDEGGVEERLFVADADVAGDDEGFGDGALDGA